MDVSVGQALKGLQYLHLTLWQLSNVCYTDRVLFLGLSGSGGGNSNVYVKGLPAVLEGMGWWVCLTGFTKQCHLCPYTSKFFVTFVSGGTGLAYHWFLSFCYFCFLEPHWIHKVSNHPVISKLMHHFYLQHPPSCKCFDPWHVECLLSLLESWASASALTTFKLGWKTATLLALVTAKHCSDLTFYVLITSTFFFSTMLPFSFPCLMARQIIWVILPLRFILSFTPMLIFALFFI